jgi:hypothetical protein
MTDDQILIEWVTQAETGGCFTGCWITKDGYAREIINFDTAGVLWALGPRVPVHPIALNHYCQTGWF